jgi:hypothetical protein
MGFTPGLRGASYTLYIIFFWVSLFEVMRNDEDATKHGKIM